MKRQRKATIKIAHQKIEIALPPIKILPSVIGHPFWFPVWSLGGFLALKLWFLRVPISWGTFIFLGIWIAFEIAGLYTLLNTYFGKEKIVFSQHGITLGQYILGIGKGNTYDLLNIHNVRLAPSESMNQGKLWFDSGNQTIRCCHNIGVAEAQRLVQQMSDLITFRCSAIETILFGSNHTSKYHPRTTLQNPDVSTLTFPFVHLKQIIIQTETYDFHLVERFLTYAINYIGQEHLKKEVVVHIYGNPEKLHPNLRNSLTNLCKNVTVHEEEKKLSPISG